MKNMKGITLIALVITIVVLIILAGVAISLSLGENGIFNKAKYATEEYANEQAREETEIAKYANEIESHVGSSRETTKPKKKVLFEGMQSVSTTATITFAEDKIDDYEYYDIIYGINPSSNMRIFSETVPKEFLQMEVGSTGWKIIGRSHGEKAFISITLTNITENSFDLYGGASGTSWNGLTVYIYKIIGRNM